MNTLFGGRFTSWLSTELRIKRGWTYGAGSGFQSWSSGGVFTANSFTRNDTLGEMISLVFTLMGKARREGFAAEELESSRNYIQGQFPPTMETNASKAAAFLRLAFFGLADNYFDDYLQQIRRVSPSDAHAAAVRLIPGDVFVLVVVGKAEEIRESLKPFGRWTEKEITDPGF